MFTAEWKYIFKDNRSLLRILLGIMLIPTFYAVIFLSSLWNPYQEISHLPVAVVNEDKTQGSINFGNKVVNNLKQNNSLDFKFITNSSAQNQLKQGKVYMVLLIPKDFSKDIENLKTSNGKSATLDYYTSAGHSFVAMKMATTAINNIKNKIANEISDSYLKEINDQDTKFINILKTSSSNPQMEKMIISKTQNVTLNKNIMEPVKLHHFDNTTVKNNGTGMAPYLISVALFVGCITLNIIYDTFSPRGKIKNGIDWWISKMSFLYIFIILAASIMYILLITVNGLTPLNVFQTYGFIILTAITFLSIVTLFNLLFGMTGAWLMLLFMIIQLGGSAGTYPIQLSNIFFRSIHPYLPMSISIDALRSTISIGNSINNEVITFLIILIITNCLMIIFFKTEYDFKNIDLNK